MKPKLISTLTEKIYPFERIEEFGDDGESLEVLIPDPDKARVREGKYIWQRFADFLPFDNIDECLSLGEGDTPLLTDKKLAAFCGIDNLLLKNETQNPTWSFKDRGSLACIAMARLTGEKVTATVSTGNMGHSMAAYGARAGIDVIVLVPDFAPDEKILAMGMHGACVIKVTAPDYSEMKKHIMTLGPKLGLRIISGNGPVRIEGYKLEAFEMYEQLGGSVPDFIAVPTSACGHVRGLFKGYRELKEAGLTDRLPRMIIVQAKNNSPIVSAIKEGRDHIVPFKNFHTVAEAISTGDPSGAVEILDKARKYNWLAEDVTEEEILEGQKILAASGLFVEPASATSLFAVKKLRHSGRIDKDQTVVLMLTGSGMKDFGAIKNHKADVVSATLEDVEKKISARLL